MNEYSKFIGSYEKQYQLSVDDLRKFNDYLGKTYNGQPATPQIVAYMRGYFKIFVNWVDAGGKTEFIITKKEIVEAVLSHNQKFAGSDFSFNTNNIALAASHAFINIEKIDKTLFDLFEDFAFIHRRAAKIINVIIKILE